MKCVLLNFLGRKVATLEFHQAPRCIVLPRRPSKRELALSMMAAKVVAPQTEEYHFARVTVLPSFGTPMATGTVFYVESWAVEMGFFGR